MSTPVKPIPDGYHSVTPYLCVRDAAAALDFYQRAFGAEVVLRLDMPDGSIAHTEFRIGNSILMMGQEKEEWGTKSPLTLGGTGLGLMVYVPNCDAVMKQALAAGAVEKLPMADQFYGDRNGKVLDPFGHEWTIATHIEDLSEAEILTRMNKLFS